MENAWKYGLDLVGYGSGNGAVVRSMWENEEKRKKIISEFLTYLPNQNSNTPVDVLTDNDGRFILDNNLLPLVIDAPIDPMIPPPNSEKNWREYWEYYFRDVDKFFNGRSPGELEPLPMRADSIRSYLNRKVSAPESLNTFLYESYPSATIRQLYRDNNEDKLKKSGDMTRYKGTIARWDNGWISLTSTNKDKTFLKILNDLSIVSSVKGAIITDDEFDALLSSLVLLSNKDNQIFSELNKNNPVYKSMVSSSMFQHRKSKGTQLTVASGYRVITKKFWDEIEVTVQNSLPNKAKRVIVKYILENKHILSVTESDILDKIIIGRPIQSDEEINCFIEILDSYK